MIRVSKHITLLFSVIWLSCSQSDVTLHETHAAIFQSRAFDIEVGQASLQLQVFDSDISYIISGIHGMTELQSDSLNIMLPKEIHLKAGSYHLYALVGHQIIDQTTVTINATKPHGKILTYLGPKTTAFNNSPGTMLTSVVTDTFNNMINTQIDLEYKFLGKNGVGQKSEHYTHEYFAYKIFPPYNNDKVLVGIKGPNNLYSVELPLEGSSGCASSATLNIPIYYPIADGRQKFSLELDDIKDVEGYDVADGTLLALHIKSNNAAQKYESISANGSSTFDIENPKLSNNYTISIYSCGNLIASKSKIQFEPSVSLLKYDWLDSGKLRIGPVTNNLNQSLPNGSPVDISILDCDEFGMPNLELYDGFVYLNLDDIYTRCSIRKLTIDIGGRQLTISVNNPIQ